ncbi:phosphotransferase [Nonomuraea sp. NPDC050643]|uniref:phosphotransferase family protein n=1 Tax=Nonomuraea sp. NPDC050643 TaxID=3155660 RepID=UPI0033C6EC09
MTIHPGNGELIDEPIRRWLSRDALPGLEIQHAEALAGGYRNANILLVSCTGDRYVLRRYLGHNTCAVEAALAGRLAGIVPVADVIAADPDGSAAGRPVMVSRYVPGDLVSTLLPGLGPGDAEALGHAVGAVLAAIGTVTFPRPGFFDGADLLPGPEGTEPAADLPAFVDRCLRTGNAHHALSAAEQDALRRHAAEAAPALRAVHGARRLVHSDFNPKNLLAARHGGSWIVTAVLDWEFAFSGSPLFDIGNMLRFRSELPPAFAGGFTAGYVGAGGHLPRNWREISQAADLYALADFLTRPPEHLFFGKAVALIRHRLAGDQQT